jgi:hypothetical protein
MRQALVPLPNLPYVYPPILPSGRSTVPVLEVAQRGTQGALAVLCWFRS